MPQTWTDDALCHRGCEALESQLGPVETLRFLALISRQPFDYQRWREDHFGEMSLSEILDRARAASETGETPSR